MERLIDLAARQFGFDRIDLRRRNLIPPKAQPYANPLGMTYDSGDYAKRHGPRAGAVRLEGLRQAPSAKRASAAELRGIGLANYIEITSGVAARVRRRSTCSRTAASTSSIGTLSSGQGHETSFAQCVAEWLGVDVERDPADPGRHRHRAGRRRLAFRPLDAHGRRRHGQGLGGGRSRRRRGSPATLLETDPADVEFAEGRFTRRRAPTARSACSRSRARPRDAQRPAGRPARPARRRVATS